MNFLKIYLLIFLVLFIILVFVLPSVKVYRQTGINPFRFATKHNKAHDFVGGSMKIFILMLFVVVIVYAFFPLLYEYFAPFSYMERDYIKIVGLFIGHISLLGIMIAQWQMKQSWRIGIDFENRTQLVTNGFFRYTRNPIYLFLLIALTGLFLVIPNAVTFGVLFAAYLILHVTMRMEEEFLLKQHGIAYEKYMQRVRRLL